MEGSAPNASRNQNKPRGGGGGFRRKYPALKDQKICLLELPPLIEEMQAQNLNHAQAVPGSSRAQTVPGPSRAQRRGRRLAQTIPGPSRAQTVPGPSLDLTLGPSHPQIVHGSSSANTASGPSHAQASSDQSTGLVVGQVVEGFIDGKFEDGYLISIKVGEITYKGVAYGLAANEPGLAPEGQTVQKEIIDLEESPRDDERHISSQPVAQTVQKEIIDLEASPRDDERHVSSQPVAQTVRRVQPWSGVTNSGGGTSSNPTKHQDKDQARDVRARGKEKV